MKQSSIMESLATDFCTIDEAAEILRVHRSQISRYIKHGYLSAERFARNLWLRREDVESFEPPGQGARKFHKIEK